MISRVVESLAVVVDGIPVVVGVTVVDVDADVVCVKVVVLNCILAARNHKVTSGTDAPGPYSEPLYVPFWEMA